jgi:hypothetical protein
MCDLTLSANQTTKQNCQTKLPNRIAKLESQMTLPNQIAKPNYQTE